MACTLPAQPGGVAPAGTMRGARHPGPVPPSAAAVAAVPSVLASSTSTTENSPG